MLRLVKAVSKKIGQDDYPETNPLPSDLTADEVVSMATAHAKYGVSVMQGVVASMEKKDWNHVKMGIKDLRRVLKDILDDLQ